MTRWRRIRCHNRTRSTWSSTCWVKLCKGFGHWIKKTLSVNKLSSGSYFGITNEKNDFLFLCLLVSGGHCQIILAKNYNKFRVIGETLDDAVGEVFDKTSRILGYGYPGGPIIENLAKKSKGKYKFKLPKPLINKMTFDLSFSGLKTSVRRLIEKGINNNQKLISLLSSKK